MEKKRKGTRHCVLYVYFLLGDHEPYALKFEDDFSRNEMMALRSESPCQKSKYFFGDTESKLNFRIYNFN